MVLGVLHLCGECALARPVAEYETDSWSLQKCDKPFENPAFFQREGKAFCEHCFSIMIRNEI